MRACSLLSPIFIALLHLASGLPTLDLSTSNASDSSQPSTPAALLSAKDAPFLSRRGAHEIAALKFDPAPSERQVSDNVLLEPGKQYIFTVQVDVPIDLLAGWFYRADTGTWAIGQYVKPGQPAGTLSFRVQQVTWGSFEVRFKTKGAKGNGSVKEEEVGLMAGLGQGLEQGLGQGLDWLGLGGSGKAAPTADGLETWSGSAETGNAVQKAWDGLQGWGWPFGGGTQPAAPGSGTRTKVE